MKLLTLNGPKWFLFLCINIVWVVNFSHSSLHLNGRFSKYCHLANEMFVSVYYDTIQCFDNWCHLITIYMIWRNGIKCIYCRTVLFHIHFSIASLWNDLEPINIIILAIAGTYLIGLLVEYKINWTVANIGKTASVGHLIAHYHFVIWNLILHIHIIHTW